jgi:class 3 adenylate cyclase/tetratricopeptide (TPR) repeat protein
MRDSAPLPIGRRQRTLLITDIVRSTEHLARIGDVRWAELLEQHEAIVDREVGTVGGRVIEDRGDGYLIEFERSTQAVACAERLCVATASLGVELRAGVHAGECELLGSRLAGIAIHIAARVADLARGSEVLVSSTVRDELSDTEHALIERGTHELRGVSGAWIVYALQSEALAAVAGTAPPPAAAAVPVPLPSQIASRLAEVAMIDRRAELAECLVALERVNGGEQRAVLITGEPGIGKTRLAAQIAGDAHAGGATVLCGRCDVELGVPYQPFVEALTHYARFAPQPLLADHRAKFGHELARLVPELGAGGPVAALEQSRAENRYLMFASVAGLLRAASLQTPLVLVLDDLHSADRATLLLLKYLLASPQLHALVVCTYRSTELPASPALSKLLSELRREPGIASIELRGLEGGDVIALAQAVTSETFDQAGAELIESLGEQTRGNPFFIGEILRTVKDSGGIAQLVSTDAGAVGSALDLPDSVRDTIKQRVTRMGPRAEGPLGAAAVIGREFDVELLSQMVDESEARVIDVLDAAVDAALLTEAPGFGLRYSFAHPLIQVALYEQLRGGRRRQLHAKAVEGLEQLLGHDARQQRSGELAHHALAAVPIVPVAKAVECAHQAGRHALEQLAPQEAIRWFEQALALHRPVTQRDADDDAQLRELLIGQGIAQQQGGDPEFRATLLRAAGLARAAGDTERLVQAVLANTRGFVSETGRVDEQRVEMLDAALEAIGTGNTRARAKLLATLAAELTFAGDWTRRKALSDESVAIADRLGDPATVGEVLSTRFITTWTPETLAQRIADTTRELAIAEELGSPLARFRALHWRAAAAVESGDLDLAASLVEREHEQAARLNQPTASWLATYDRATQALIHGLLEEAERSAEDACRIASDSGEPESLAFYAGQLVNIRFEQGRLGELEPMITEQVRANPGIPAFRGALALARCEAQLYGGAAEAIAVDADTRFAELPYDSNWLVGIVIYAEAAAQIEDLGAAATLRELLIPWRDQIAFNSATTWGSVERQIGNLERVLGRPAEAERALTRAAELHERIGAPIWLARTRVDLAHLLAVSTDEAERARTLVEQALATARDLGCAGIERRAAELLATLEERT